MKTIYTEKIGEYYEAVFINDGKDIKKIPYSIEVSKSAIGINDDLLMDWLDSWDYSSIKNPEIHNQSWAEIYSMLENYGYDMNYENYIRVSCPYLKFNHYYHVPTMRLL